MTSVAPNPERTAYVSRMKGSVLRVVEELEEEVKEMCTKTSSTPLSTPSLQLWQYDRAENRLLSLLKSLQEVVHHRLYFSAKLEYFYASQVAMQQSRSTSGESMSILEKRLFGAQNAREEALDARESMIESLTTQLRDLNHDGERALISCREEAEKEREEVTAASATKLNDLEEQLQNATSTMMQHQENHEQQEFVLRTKRLELERSLQHQICRYDATMSSLQTKLDDLRDHHTELTSRLAKKRAEFEVLEKRYDEIELEKRRVEEEKMAAMQAVFRREHAARIIQRAWHHYKMRKMLKKAQRKRKKKTKDVKEKK